MGIEPENTAAATPETPTPKPAKTERSIRFSGPAWDWVVARAAEEDISAAEFVRRTIDLARLMEPMQKQVAQRLTSLEERMANIERRENGKA